MQAHKKKEWSFLQSLYDPQLRKHSEIMCPSKEKKAHFSGIDNPVEQYDPIALDWFRETVP